MVKFKKLKFRRPKTYYRYHLKMSKEDFKKISHPIAFNIKQEDSFIAFDTTKEGLKKWQDESFFSNLVVIDKTKQIFNNIVKNHIVVLISLFIIIFLFLSSSQFIREITFKNELDYDYDVYMTVVNHIDKVGPFYKLDCTLNEMGNELRTTYPHFAYIGINKVGAKLEIEIIKQNVPIINDQDKPFVGDIYAAYDGYIIGAIVKKGILCVTTSQSVKKGDLLISGNLDYKTNPNMIDKYIHPEGLIIANVATYEKVTVLKTNKETRYSGDNQKYYIVKLFNHYLGNSNQMVDKVGYKSIHSIFNLGSFFTIYQVYSYGMSDITIDYDEKTALAYAISKIKYDFSLDIKSDKEKIISIDLILTNETNNAYEFTFLVKSIRNIGEFHKIKQSS